MAVTLGVFELTPIAFRKLTVKICVVGNDDVSVCHKGRDDSSVDPLPATISFVIPVRGVISAGIQLAGSFNEPKLSR